jgi:hypothetical protein
MNGITSVQVNITFSDDIVLSIESLGKSSLLFAYCTQGQIKHSFGVSGHSSTLRKHQSAVVTSNRTINTLLYFKKNIPLTLSLIKVETEGLLPRMNDPLILKLKKTFLNKPSNYIYQGIQNLKITEKFNQFNAITEQGMTGQVLKKDLLQSILLMEIDDNTDNLVKISRAIKDSALHQINELKKLPDFIRHYALEALYSRTVASKNKIIRTR